MEFYLLAQGIQIDFYILLPTGFIDGYPHVFLNQFFKPAQTCTQKSHVMQLNFISVVNTFQIAEVTKVVKRPVSIHISSASCQISIWISLTKLALAL